MKNGVYNAVEQAIVDEVHNKITPETAANTTVNLPVATRDAIRNFTEWVDPWNPLFNDPERGRLAGYGGLIAPPHFLESVNSYTVWPPHPTQGFLDHDYAGDYFEYDRPIQVGDRFTVKRKGNTLEDLSEQIDNGLKKNDFRQIASGTPEEWVRETLGLCTRIYADTPEGTEISYDYVARYAPIIESQLLRAGLRLAQLLNEIYG